MTMWLFLWQYYGNVTLTLTLGSEKKNKRKKKLEKTWVQTSQL